MRCEPKPLSDLSGSIDGIYQEVRSGADSLRIFNKDVSQESIILSYFSERIVYPLATASSGE